MPTEAAANNRPVPARPAAPSNGSHIFLSLALLLLFAAAAALRFLFLTRKPFWFDECFSVEAARLDWPNVAHLLWWREANMLLYYVLLRAWLHFGASGWWIRSLSVIFSLAALPAIYRLANLLFDRRVAIISVALLSVNAYHVRYAQEARSYTLFLLLAVLSSGYFCAYLQKPSRGNFTGYALTSILVVYSHFYALLLVMCQALALWGLNLDSPAANPAREALVMDDSLREMRRAWIWIGIAVSPLLIFIAKTGAGPIRWIQRPGFHYFLEYYIRLAGNGGWPLLAVYVAACATAIAPFGTKLFSRTADPGGKIWRVQFLLLWLLFPVVLTAVLSLARPVFLARYLIFCLPALILLAAAGVARLRKTWQLGAALAVMLLLSLQGTRSYYRHDFDLERDGIGAATNYVLDHAQPGDAVLFHIAETRAAYEYYRSARDGDAGANLPNTFDPEIIYPRHGDRLDYRDFTGKPTAEFLRSVTPRYDRVWVVLMNNGGALHADAATLMLSEIMTESFPAMQQWEFPRVGVRLYSKR